MKRIALLLLLFCLGLTTASFAVAKDGPGKGKGKKSSSTTAATSADPATCQPKISVILKGTFVSGAGTSFRMDVKQSNSHGKEHVGEAVTLMVDDKTKFRRRGSAELSDFEAGDRLNVQARACKARKQKNKGGTTTTTPAASAPAAPMIAKRVVGQPAKASTTTTTP
jgi:hypothetical protein